jgi:tRNA (mo5U34)-methyltransferase
MTGTDWQAKIDNLRWYHEFDFGNGLRARNLHPSALRCRRIWKFIAKHLDQIDFREKSVLDIGCWDGYWSFDAERRGAKNVLATDDVTQNWSGGEGLQIAKQLLQSSIEVNQHLSVYNLSSLDRKFDIVLCLGVFYHLIDPFRALAEIRHCCHDKTLVLFEGDMAVFGWGRGAAQFRSAKVSDKWPWTFLPSPSAFDGLVRAAYFRTQSRHYLSSPGRNVLKWIKRVILTRRLSPIIDRTLVTCSAFEGTNEFYTYPPPFGLYHYDDRFRGAVQSYQPDAEASDATKRVSFACASG